MLQLMLAGESQQSPKQWLNCILIVLETQHLCSQVGCCIYTSQQVLKMCPRGNDHGTDLTDFKFWCQ